MSWISKSAEWTPDRTARSHDPRHHDWRIERLYQLPTSLTSLAVGDLGGGHRWTPARLVDETRVRAGCDYLRETFRAERVVPFVDHGVQGFRIEDIFGTLPENFIAKSKEPTTEEFMR